MSVLTNKKILLIAPRFFEYEKAIAQQMVELGASVKFIPDRPFARPWQIALTKVIPLFFQPFVDIFYLRKIKPLKNEPFDIILIINGQTISRKTLNILKSFFLDAKFILYLWDSVENRPNLVESFSSFDKVLTFDSTDAKNYHINFRPLFFTADLEHPPQTDFRYDISFIGTMHSDRFQLATKVIKALPAHTNPYWYFYLQAKWVFYLYKLTKTSFKKATVSQFYFHPISKKALKEVFKASKIILDIEHPKQNGLTMRTFEAMAANKKLVTTNANITDYDFYKPENVCIIDRNAPYIPSKFWESEYTGLSSEVYSKYKLKNWLIEVLS